MSNRLALSALAGVLLAAVGQSRAAEPAPAADRVRLTSFSTRNRLSLVRSGATAVLLTNQSTRVSMEVGSRRIQFNGCTIWMNAPLLSEKLGLTLSTADVRTLLDPLLNPTPDGSFVPTVIVDAGHGGKDTGAIGPGGVVEKRVVLELAKRVTRDLKKRGMVVRMTRNRDSTIELAERAQRAAAWKGDVFVSIHLNSAGNTNAGGVETYVLPPAGYSSTSGIHTNLARAAGNAHDRANIILAYCIHRQLLRVVGTAGDRGIKHARFDVLTGAPCPAVLVECGFLTNEADERALQQETHLDALAEAIVNGIVLFSTAR